MRRLSVGSGGVRPMRDGRSLGRLQRVARLRVTLGFVAAALALWFARPAWGTLGLGAVVAACGEGVRVWAAGHIRKGEEVTTSGPYRLTRHPLYAGSCILGVGFVLAAASVVVAAIVGGYLGVMLWAAITLEEATLRQAFGTEYDRYVAGQLEPSDRRFSMAQAIRNGEHRTLLGFVVVLGVLTLKVWTSGSGASSF